MKKLLKIPFLLISALVMFLTSCEDVIKLELKSSATRVVIDATLNASLGECNVELTNSVDFYQTGSLAKIVGAKVELNDKSGIIIALPEVKPGHYFANGLAVGSGDVFSLRVTLPSGDVFTAKTEIPVRIPLDSLKVVRGFEGPGPNIPPVFLLNPMWKDPAGIANFYRFKVTKKGTVVPGSFSIYNDEPFDGTEVDMPLDQYEFQIGDTVCLEFQSIDSVSYSYYNQINDMAMPGFISATPYNPIGNFDNGALGYFGIYYSEVWDTIIAASR
jgi:hypothetical protein